MTGPAWVHTLTAMADDKLYMAFNQATQQWPQVNWSRRDYAVHVKEIREMGSKPSHLVDLYLAGAAGHRMDPAWEAIQQDIGPAVQRILTRQPLADLTIEDLWGETVMNLMDNDDTRPCLTDGSMAARIVRYHGLVKLINYCVTIAQRVAIQRHRKRKPALASDVDAAFERSQSPSHTPLQELQQTELIETMTNLLAQAYASLSAEQQFLLTMIYCHGMKQKEAGKLIGLSEFTANRRVKSAIKLLRSTLDCPELAGHIQISPQLWNAVWQAAWPDTDQQILSKPYRTRRQR